ncbi:hypothetical protein ACHWQZ_G009156 [Mnemiopsis leidyi]
MSVKIDGSPSEVMIPKKSDHHESGKETLFLKIMNSSLYTVVLWLFICGSAVIFMGIEGNHQQLVAWRNLEELEVFNKTLYKWITKNESVAAKTLRKEIGLDEHLEEWQYIDKVTKQMNKNFSAIFNKSSVHCNLANHDLKSWHNMTHSLGDSFMFAVSIVATVGWGVHFPPSFTLRIVTIVYAVLGVPLFTTFIGFQIDFVKYVENRLKKNKFIKSYFGGSSTINAGMGLVMVVIALIYSSFSLHMVNQEKKHPGIKEDLEIIGEQGDWNFFSSLYFTFQTVSTIGFGDQFIFSAERHGAMLYLKPIFIIAFTAFLIALFTHVFGKMQEHMDRRAAAKSRKSVSALRSMSVGVRKVSMQAMTVTKGAGNSGIQKRVEVLKNENFEKGEEEKEDSDVLFLDQRNNRSKVDVLPVMVEQDGTSEHSSCCELSQSCGTGQVLEIVDVDS